MNSGTAKAIEANVRPHCYPSGMGLKDYFESTMVSPQSHHPLKLQGDCLVDEMTGQTFIVEGDCPNFLPELPITEHQVSELDVALQWVKDLQSGKLHVPYVDVSRFYDQTKICYDPFLPWINSQTVKPDTKLVCIGGCFADDLPHVFSYYKFNVDHLSNQYLRHLPDIKGSYTHYLNCTSEQMPFASQWADIV
jgi:hypothetical protein